MATNFQWRPDFDRVLLLSNLSRCRTIDNQKVSFKAFEYHFWLPVLMSAIEATREASPYHSKCIQRALSDASLDLSKPDKFTQRCEKEFAALRALPNKKFHVLFYITYVGPNPVNRIKDGDCVIQWNPGTSNKILKRALRERESLKADLSFYRVADISSELTPVIVTTLAQNYEDAQQKALDVLDQFRGLLNVLANASRPVTLWNSERHAINRFRLGPYWTVHDEVGALASQSFWYEPRWEHRSKSAKFKGSPEEIRRSISGWWKKARNNPLAETISGGLLRYCRSLDVHQTDSVLLGLWGAIEHLTGTQNARYFETVHRLGSVFSNGEYGVLLAQHIRTRRNATVHSARSPGEGEVDMVLRHADILAGQILCFLIQKGHMFKNEPQLVQFLDLDADVERLDEKAALIKKWKKHRRLA